MKEGNYQRLFSGLKTINPPSDLLGVILAKIDREIRRKAIIRFTLTSLTSIASLVGMIFAISFVSKEISQLGTYQYISLIFFDGNAILSYWKEFVMLVVESLPVTGMIAVLVATFTLLGSVKIATKNAAVAFSTI